MSMRGVDLQTILFRMQEIDRTQTLAVQQPKAVQEQLVHQFSQDVHAQQRQVVNTPRAEGNRIKEKESSRERNQGRQRRSPQQQDDDEPPKERSAGFIDVRV